MYCAPCSSSRSSSWFIAMVDGVCRIINPARMPKRDRWSSDDENDVDDEGHGKCTSNVEGKYHGDGDGDGCGGCGSLPRSSIRPTPHHPSSSHYRRLHNPLLHGSRSVYDSYTRLSHIDSGTYGIVWRAKCNFTNEIVALKQIKFDNELTKEGFPISALREINVLLALQHPNIVHVKEVVLGGGRKRRHENMEEEEEDEHDNISEMEQPQIYMVMECLEMDLQRAMMMTPDPSSTLRVGGGGGGMVLPFAQSEVKFMMHSLLSAIEHIHSHWYLHRDIKTSNILLRRNGHLVLCDFGLARKYELPATRAMTMSVVTLWYRAPELLFGECRYGPEIDMWSVGCIFGELLIKDAILKGNGELDQIQQIFKLLGPPNETSWPTFSSLPSSGTFKWKSGGGEGSRSSTSSTSSSDLRRRFSVNSSFSSTGCQSYLDSAGFDLLEKLLTLDPTRRMNARDALNHDYFKGGGGVKMQVPDFFFSS